LKSGTGVSPVNPAQDARATTKLNRAQRQRPLRPLVFHVIGYAVLLKDLKVISEIWALCLEN